MIFSTKFICATREYSTYEKHIPSPLFRKSFTLKDGVKSAAIRICGLGFYDLFINGKKITKGYLAPYISNSDDMVYYDDYDLTPYLNNGENCIGTALGNGMQNSVGGKVWSFDEGRFRSAPKLAIYFECVYENGEKYTFEANDGFKCTEGPILFDDLRCGVMYDARLFPRGWNDVGFDDGEWRLPLTAETPRGDLRVCAADPIVETERLKPIIIGRKKLATYEPRSDQMNIKTQITPEQNSEGILYDFGRNFSGIFELKIKAEKGRKITLQFLEYINNDGDPSISNMPFYPLGYFQRETYICSGEDEESFIPPFTYNGARYCLVMGISEKEATEELLTVIHINSDLHLRGDFDCSDSDASELFKLSMRSDISNFHYFPTDCPHREKNGWMGDAAVSCEHMLMTRDPERSYREWLFNIRKAQREDGRLPGIVPTAGWGFDWGNGPAWDQAMFELPYRTYLLRGETDMLHETKYAFMKYVAYIDSRRDEKGLVAIGLGDWCHANRSNEGMKAPLTVTDSIISMSICEKAAYMLRVINKTAWAEFAAKIAGELKECIRRHLIDFNTMTVSGNCQTSQAMAIYYGVFTNAEKYAAGKKLIELCEKEDNHLDVGMLGVRVLFRVLSDIGESERAYNMICRRDNPSYGYWLEKNATTLLEDFNRLENRTPSSLNHHFMGDFSAWFMESVAGININPFKVNCREFQIKPHFIKKLSYAESFHDTVEGRLFVRWEREADGEIAIVIRVPKNTVGSLVLPNGFEFSKKLDSRIAGRCCYDFAKNPSDREIKLEIAERR